MNITEQIESVILSNLHSKHDRKIGVEYESIIYNKHDNRIPANSNKELSSESIITELEKLQVTDKINSIYTLEPGGQIEWASPPLKTIGEINQYLDRHKTRLNEIVEREELKVIDQSVDPNFEPRDIQLIDSKKYGLMNKMFSKTGNLGPWMMRNTSSVQINIDYTSREEAEKMAFIIDCLTPIASILFANSPFWKGKPVGNLNVRYKIWSKTDNSRCGNLLDHGIDSDKNLIQKYSEYLQSVPAIFINDKHDNIVEFPGTLGQWLENLNKKGQLTTKEIQIALHQMFTHIRFKNVIEIRSCDKPPRGFEMAPVAFWIGILYDDETLDEIYNTVKDWTITERNQLKENAFVLDLRQKAPQNRTIGEWINAIIEISKKGINNRKKHLNIEDESAFLTDYSDYFQNNGIPSLFAQKQKI